jgi:uncharacterized membrane protein HdeD (DUF308 family)
MTNGVEEVDQEMLSTIKRHGGLGIVVGVVMVVAGALAIFCPFVAGLSVTIAVGVLLIVSGVSRLFFAFKMGSFGRGLLMFVLGVLTIVAGGYLAAQPGIGLATLTMFLAAYLLVHGVFEIIWAFRLRPIKGWGWTLFSGIAAVILGIMIWREFPASALWAVGLLVGIHMIFAGTSISSLSGAARGAAIEPQAA